MLKISHVRSRRDCLNLSVGCRCRVPLLRHFNHPCNTPAARTCSVLAAGFPQMGYRLPAIAGDAQKKRSGHLNLGTIAQRALWEMSRDQASGSKINPKMLGL